MRYEYQCLNVNCKSEFEVMRSVADRSLTTMCPACGSKAKRVFSNLTMQFAMKPGESYMDRIDWKKMHHEQDVKQGIIDDKQVFAGHSFNK